jgi:hypothetical protein
MARKLFGRLRRKPPPNLRQFALDVQEVMLARITRGMNGTLSTAEARKMVLEKQAASIRAQMAHAKALLDGDPAAANRAFFDVYDREVQSNRRRLRKRWWHRLIAR